MEKIDFIGDLHGRATMLSAMLEKLGYARVDGVYKHETRKVCFLGDFIDRNGELDEHRTLLDIVMGMVRTGSAVAVMGNHEYNALAYNTKHEGGYIRKHSAKNNAQHRAFLEAYKDDEKAKGVVLEFFYSLPMWRDFGDCRAVHACWDGESIEYLSTVTDKGMINETFLKDASVEGSKMHKAVNLILKGAKVELPDGTTFKDGMGSIRTSTRVKWWNTNASCLSEILLPEGLCVVGSVPTTIPKYAGSNKPCFIGHYELKGETSLVAANIACLDKAGAVLAYCFGGEEVLFRGNFEEVV